VGTVGADQSFQVYSIGRLDRRTRTSGSSALLTGNARAATVNAAPDSSRPNHLSALALDYGPCPVPSCLLLLPAVGGHASPASWRAALNIPAGNCLAARGAVKLQSARFSSIRASRVSLAIDGA